MYHHSPPFVKGDYNKFEGWADMPALIVTWLDLEDMRDLRIAFFVFPAEIANLQYRRF
jgi:hypothetical protein